MCLWFLTCMGFITHIGDHPPQEPHLSDFRGASQGSAKLAVEKWGKAGKILRKLAEIRRTHWQYIQLQPTSRSIPPSP